MKALLTLLVTLLVTAQTPTLTQRPRIVYGAGTKSCVSWTASRKTPNWYVDGSWVLGFVSAASLYFTVPLRDTSSQDIAAWIDDYCLSHPDDDISDAAGLLLQALGAR